MIPPRGLKQEVYPLQHEIKYSFGLSMVTLNQNTALATLVRHTKDVDVAPSLIEVNPHNTNMNLDTGAVCAKMSIIDKLTLSLKFNMTEHCATGHLSGGTAGPNFDDGIYEGDSIQSLKFLWRPIFFSFPEKLQASDDGGGGTVETILALTSDDTNEDVVPLTTNKLPVGGTSELSQPVSTVNQTEAIADLNYTSDLTMEDHVWDEQLFQNAKRRFTNKGALKACVGRTRYVTLTPSRPYKNFYIDKFVPRSIRRIVDRTFFAIQVHVPVQSDIEQSYHATSITASVAHLGVKIIANYHEWNIDHFQEMTGTAS